MEAHPEKKAEVERIRANFERSKDAHIWKDYVNALRLVSQVVFTRSSGFVLEFIQNAEDARKGQSGSGEVSISVNKERLRFVHNGYPFENENLRAICGIQSSKKPERGTLGYLGIGFKSAFKVADCVEVYSNGFQFKFDRHHSDWASSSSDTPWHVIPIWIDKPSETIESDKTTSIVRLRNQSAFAHLMEGLEQIRAELYLFLKWIRRIQITDEMSGKFRTLENLGEANGITTLKQGDDPGRRSQTRFALGYYLSGFQPLSLERQVECFSPSWPSLENILPELKTVLPNADLIAFLLLAPCLTQHESHRHCSRVVRWCGLANSSCLC